MKINFDNLLENYPYLSEAMKEGFTGECFSKNPERVHVEYARGEAVCGQSTTFRGYDSAGKRRITLEEILNKEVCRQCAEANSRDNLANKWVTGFESLKLHYYDRKVTNAVKVTTRLTAEMCLSRINTLTEISESLKGLKFTDHGLGTALREAKRDEVIKRAEAGLIPLKEAQVSPERRQELQERLQVDLLPEKFKDYKLELDDTPSIIGIHPKPYVSNGALSKKISTIFSLYSIREDDGAVVLLAPAYIYTFLVGKLTMLDRRTLVVSMKAPENKEDALLAATLWRPDDPAGLASMKKVNVSVNALGI